MAIDTSIYGNQLRPPTSIADYDAANQDFQKNQLAIQGVRQTQSDANALRTATQQFGTDPNANRQLLAGTGNFKAVQDFDKASVDNAKTRGEISLNTSKAGEQDALAQQHVLDTNIKNHDFHIQQLGAITDPSQVPNWIADGVHKGVFTFQQGSDGLNKFNQQSQQPGGFEAWKQAALQGGITATEQLKQRQTQLIADNTNLTSRQNNTDTNATHITTTGMTNATTRRGQDLVNQRAVEARGDAQMQPDYKQQDDGTWVALPKKVPLGGTITATPVMGADGKPLLGSGKPLTGEQGKATTFAARMQDAEGTIGQLEAQGIKGSDLRTIAAGNMYTNFLASPQGQQYRQAQENWVTANLRQESGAAIGKDEMSKDVAKFFAKPGDSDVVIAQKARARAVAQQGMLTQAGPGARSVPTILKNASSGGPAKIASDADYNALPSGAEFIAPDGSHRKKP